MVDIDPRLPRFSPVLPEQRITDVDPFEAEEDIPVADTISSAFSNTGVVTGGANLLRESLRPAFTPDPNFDPADYASTNPNFKKVLDRAGDPMMERFLDNFRGSRSVSEFDDHLMQFEQFERDEQVAAANPVANFVGAALGIAPDVALTALVPSFGAVTVGANASRLAAAARVALFGAAEGFTERGVHALTNESVTTRDILLSTAAGGAIGGALGAGVASLANRVYSPTTVDELVADAREVSGRDLGAAASRPDPELRQGEVPAPGSQGAGLASRLGTGLAAQTFLRNPKRILVDFGVEGASPGGLAGDRAVFEVGERLVRISTDTVADKTAVLGRAPSAQDILEGIEVKALTTQLESDELHAATVREIFGVGTVRRQLGDNGILSIGDPGITKEQFRALADEVALATDSEVPFEDLVQHMGLDLTPEQLASLQRAASAQAEIDNKFYRDMAQAEVDLGVIGADDVIENYRPQVWNTSAIEDDVRGFRNFLVEVFRKTPDDQWLRDSGFGDNWRDLVRSDPDLANEAAAAWDDATNGVLRTAKADKKLDDAFTLRDAVRRAASEAGLDIKLDERIASNQRAIPRFEKRLAEARNDIDRARLSKEIARRERQLARDQQLLDDASSARLSDAEVFDRMINSVGSRTLRQAIKKADAAVAKAERAVEKAADVPNVIQQADDVVAKILSGEDPWGLIPDQALIGTSSRFQRRNIHLGKMRFTPEARRFLRTNPERAMNAYTSSTGSQIALRRVFGTTTEGAINKDEIFKRIDSAYADDVAANPSRTQEILQKKRQARGLIEGLTSDFTRAHLTGRSTGAQGLADAEALATSVSSIAMLGGAAISSLSDVIATAIAGGRLRTGFAGMFTRRGKIIKEIEAMGERELATIIAGPSVLDGSRVRSLAAIDNPQLDVPGGRFREFARTMTDAASLSMHVNLMNQWNKFIRSSFGIDFARQISKDVTEFSSLKPAMRTFYARMGIGEREAKQMADMFARHSKEVQGIRLPDTAAWARENPFLLERLKVAMKAAGDEAMLSPGVGDRPFLNHYPGGRIVNQFTAFTFTASERLIAPIMQKLRAGDTAAMSQALVGLTGALAMGVMVDFIKSSTRGAGQEWLDQDLKDKMWAGLLRSPMMGGRSGTFTEIGLNSFGDKANELAEHLGGPALFRERPTKFRDSQPLVPLLGPAFSLANRGFVAGQDIVTEGDAEKAMRLMPIANTFYMQAILNAME